MRARIVLKAADGESATATALEMKVCLQTVGKWRKRYAERGADGLLDEPRPGQPRKITDADVERVLTLTLESKPKAATHWSTREMAKASGINQTAISRIWRAFSLAPHRAETFKLSKDPLFIDKVRDIVGLYLNPPERALVLCVDEKSQIQALDSTAPLLPMGPGRSSAGPTTIRSMAPPAYSLRWIPRPARSSDRTSSAIVPWSSATSSTPSKKTCLKNWTSTSSWTITELTKPS
jgi:transposase